MSAPEAPSAPPAGVLAGLRALVRDLLDFDRRALVVLVWVPVALTAMEYVFLPPLRWRPPPPAWVADAHQLLARWLPSAPRALVPWLWWGIGCLTMMVAVPMALLAGIARTGPRATGVRVRGTGRDARLYLVLFLVFAPVVWLVSRRPDFAMTYPFYPPRASGKVGADWVAFEAVYFLQFFAVEYFFRGFMVLGLKPSLGRASVLVMLAPYCMIHFHKPALEALGAVGAGLVLGSLSWRTGTVVWGWFLHYAVALSMDLLSLAQSGRL